MKRFLSTLALVFAICAQASALTLLQIGQASGDEAWKARVRARLLQSAIAVTTESVGTANHVQRILWAGDVLREPEKWASRLAVVVAGQSGPAGAASLTAVTDSQINTAVDSVIDSYALNAMGG